VSRKNKESVEAGVKMHADTDASWNTDTFQEINLFLKCPGTPEIPES
jgi:hypothetical protein